MTVTYHFFDSAPVYQADWSKSIGKALQDGVLCGVDNDLFVYGDASGMQVKVKTGACHMKGHYYFSDAEQTLAIGAAPGTAGQSRWDLVVGEVNWTTKVMSVKIVAGTASASPTLPSLTRSSTVWQIAIALVVVAYGDTNVPATKVYDYRQWALGIFDVPLIIGNGVSAISASTSPPVGVTIPGPSKIVSYTLVGNASGSIQLDLWKDTYLNYPPLVADTICHSSYKPALSSVQKIRKTVWNEATYINGSGANWPGHAIAGVPGNLDVYYILPYVDSVTGLTMVNLTLRCARCVSAQS
jgi:hypothetical protein